VSLCRDTKDIRGLEGSNGELPDLLRLIRASVAEKFPAKSSLVDKDKYYQ